VGGRRAGKILACYERATKDIWKASRYILSFYRGGEALEERVGALLIARGLQNLDDWVTAHRKSS